MGDRTTPKPELPALQRKMLDDAAKDVVKFYKDQIKSDIRNGRLKPVRYWEVNRGQLLLAEQTYTAICVLLTYRSEKPFLPQAGVLTRTLFETLASIMYLAEKPVERTATFEYDAYDAHAARHKYLKARHGNDPAWQAYDQQYQESIDEMRTMLGNTHGPSTLLKKSRTRVT